MTSAARSDSRVRRFVARIRPSTWIAWMVAGLVLGLGAASAAPGKPGPASKGPASPELVAHAYGPAARSGERALNISNFDVSVRMAGGVAQTTAVITFHNPGVTPLEGDFTLDLPAGAVVTGYALDINGQMVDGVLVGKRQGELAYQKKVRQNLDPGIAEVTRDNAFRTHVFPIPAHGDRTVQLKFANAVGPDAPYVLPLNVAEPIHDVSFEVIDTDRGAKDTPLAVKEPGGMAAHWIVTDEGLRAKSVAEQRVLYGALEISAPRPPRTITVARHHSGESFFEISDAGASAGRALEPRSVRLYWDTSRSRRADDVAAERALVAHYLAQVKPETVDLVLFADGAPRIASFHGADAPQAVDDALKAVHYEGATSFARVFDAALGAADACLFFSDGRATIDSWHAQRVRCPLFTVSTAKDADHSVLSALARKSGGEHIALDARASDVALAHLTRRAVRPIAVTGADGEPLDFTVLPSGPDSFRLIGRMPTSGEARVTLSGGEERSYRLTQVRPVDSDGLGALWAADRAADLAASDHPDNERILALTRRYSVATEGSVFLVLENAEDYADAEIVPPASLGKEVLETYRKALADREVMKAKKQAERITLVREEWNEQKAWWATAFNPHAKPKALNGKSEDEDAGPAADAAAAPAIQAREMAPPPLPAPAPPPPPMVAPGVASPVTTQTTVGEVVVTGARMHRSAFTSASPLTTIGGATADDGAPEAKSIQVETAAWNPKRPYLDALNAASSADFPRIYREQEQTYGDLPAFYFDVAEWLFRKGRAQEAISTSLNVLELPTADDTTLTILADRLMRYGDDARALWLYERLLQLEPDRPQPRRNLALALIERADRTGAAAESDDARKQDYARALSLLNEVVTKAWSDSYQGVELIALMEANRVIPRYRALGGKDVAIDPRLIAQLDVDLRVTLEWNVDATDMDLWVDEPNRERAIYNNPRTAIGGRLSHDMTQGYGPEEYLLRRAPDGTYTVRVNIYRTDALNPNGAITVRARLWRAYGRPDEQAQVMDLELKPGQDNSAQVVGTIKVGK